MKKLSKKFRILLIIVIALGIVFIDGKCQAYNVNESPEPTQFKISEQPQMDITTVSIRVHNLIRMIRIILPIIMILFPTIRFLIVKNKIKNKDLPEDEKIEKNTKNRKSFFIWIVIMEIFAIFLDMVILGEIKEPVL